MMLKVCPSNLNKATDNQNTAGRYTDTSTQIQQACSDTSEAQHVFQKSNNKSASFNAIHQTYLIIMVP